MGIGRFHTICDHCQSKSEEYGCHTVWCKECGLDTCEKCSEEGDYVSGPDNWAVCKQCKEQA